MRLIKLDATDSTNAYLRLLLSSEAPQDYTVVSAVRQRQGKGQMGAEWESEAGKNLTFSMLKRNLSIHVDNVFILNICASLAIYKVLKQYEIPNLSIKWPNDILSGTSKICGILIENKLKGLRIVTSIVGIGLNVNQLEFNNLHSASSLRLITEKIFDLDDILIRIVDALKATFLEKDALGHNGLWKTYESVLFQKGKLSIFEHPNGERFSGTIVGVSTNGKLNVALQDNTQKAFDLKEVKLVYA